eukprot:5208106-Amphidinium_carterae.1
MNDFYTVGTVCARRPPHFFVLTHFWLVDSLMQGKDIQREALCHSTSCSASHAFWKVGCFAPPATPRPTIEAMSQNPPRVWAHHRLVAQALPHSTCLARPPTLPPIKKAMTISSDG